MVPDTLSRLPGSSSDIAKEGPRILEALYGMVLPQGGPLWKRSLQQAPSEPSEANSVYFHVTLVEMSQDFKDRLGQEYTKDEQWNKVLEVVKKANKEAEASLPVQGPATKAGELPQLPVQTNLNRTNRKLGLRFKLRNRLLYYTNFNNGRERLCIPNSLEKEIFKLAHDRQHHSGFHRTYERIVASLYLRHLLKNLRTYIDHCPDCKLNQTKRHLPYGSLVPIDRPRIPFYTIAMDFVVALPITTDNLDALLTVTDKFSKRLYLIPSKSTYTTADWADKLLATLVQQG